MQSKAQTVTAYIQEAPENRQAPLSELRALCQKVLAGYEESMDYGMPSYKKDGKVEVGFTSQKNYIALYPKSLCWYCTPIMPFCIGRKEPNAATRRAGTVLAAAQVA